MKGSRKALIVANDEYEHTDLQHLLSAAADAEALAKVLRDPQIGGFHVEVARNSPAHKVSTQIDELFSQSGVDDLLLLHFSCHGIKDDSGALYLATSNTKPKLLRSTAIPAAFVHRCMQESRSRSIVLLLDCCFGGAFSQGGPVRASGDANVLDSFPVGRLGRGRGRAIITASSSMEFAFEGDRLADGRGAHPSIFTDALVKGLATGDADRDEDGLISLDELYDYVFDSVQERNPHQTPSKKFEIQGDLYLARSRRRRIQPVAPPADLRAAMTDTNMITRIGAVTELRSLLVGDNLPAAAGAFDALTEIANRDVRHIVDAPQAARREAVIQPEETVLDFGQVTQATPPPHRTLRLLGPPVARACTADPSHRWIQVGEAKDGFDVSVDTSQIGSLSGSLRIKGPTGDLTVPVRIEIVPSPAPMEPAIPDTESKATPVKATRPMPSAPRGPAAEDAPTAAATPKTAAKEPTDWTMFRASRRSRIDWPRLQPPQGSDDVTEPTPAPPATPPTPIPEDSRWSRWSGTAGIAAAVVAVLAFCVWAASFQTQAVYTGGDHPEWGGWPSYARVWTLTAEDRSVSTDFRPEWKWVPLENPNGNLKLRPRGCAAAVDWSVAADGLPVGSGTLTSGSSTPLKDVELPSDAARVTFTAQRTDSQACAVELVWDDGHFGAPEVRVPG